MRGLVALLAIALLAGCTSQTASPLVDGEPVASPYAGPMHLPLDRGEDATVLQRSGAAGRALECDSAPYAAGSGDYNGGLESVQSSAARALQNYFDKEGMGQVTPTNGFRIERDDGDRVLFSYDVGGELADNLDGGYLAHATVPAGAVDTGFHRDGRQLWLAADHTAAYLVSRADAGDVERWPAATRPIGCA